MRFASGLAALLLLTGTPARANEEPRDKLDPPDDDQNTRTPQHDGAERRSTTPRSDLGEALSAQLQTIDRSLARVGEKLSLAEAQRVRRLRAAYRILRQPLHSDPTDGDRMASARRRAAARMLLERDNGERKLLANEASHLHAAQLTKIEATAKVPSIELPEQIARPVRRGEIARRFGTYQHERSKAILSRRGIDFEVELHADASAPADGVVRYSGPIRGLDFGVIVDHGDYLTIIAKLQEVAIPVGTRVERGERLGRAARHRVYFELRAKVSPGGLPIDPEPLLAR